MLQARVWVACAGGRCAGFAMSSRAGSETSGRGSFCRFRPGGQCDGATAPGLGPQPALDPMADFGCYGFSYQGAHPSSLLFDDPTIRPDCLVPAMVASHGTACTGASDGGRPSLAAGLPGPQLTAETLRPPRCVDANMAWQAIPPTGLRRRRLP